MDNTTQSTDIQTARAIKVEFIEDKNGDCYCPMCFSYDLDQFGIDGFECNKCHLRIS